MAGFDGEQYARCVGASAEDLHVTAADPLNFQGILTPGVTIPASARLRVQVG